jgi:serine phosphatase RsbU (regulator of sigma subunit)
LPALPGLDLAARYVAGGVDQEVGGDWFDVFPIDGGRVGLAIGDVMGHDLVAATNMAQIRAALRAYAWQGDAPGRVLDQLDQFVTTFALTPLVTVFYGVLDTPGADGTRILRYANAGHLPPLLQSPEGSVQDLAGGGSVIVGGLLGDEREQAEQRVTVGSTIVLFTDGLVETPNEGLDDSLAALAGRIATQEPSLSVDQLSEWVVRGATGDQKDDVAVLIVRILATEPPGAAPSGTARAEDAGPGLPDPIPGPDGHPSATTIERPDNDQTADDAGAHTDSAVLPIT